MLSDVHGACVVQCDHLALVLEPPIRAAADIRPCSCLLSLFLARARELTARAPWSIVSRDLGYMYIYGNFSSRSVQVDNSLPQSAEL